MIEIKKLAKRYEGGEALRGIDFVVTKGEICAVAGKSGSGKTTLADLLSGCIEADSGHIVICGADMVERSSEARQHLGYAPALPALYEDMTPRAGMKFVADARGIGSREANDLIDSAIRCFNLKDVADTPVSNLSSGVRKMVSLAQASFADVDVLVIDEPTEGLDPRETLEVRKALLKLKKDHAILLTSKSMTEMCAVADRVLVLSDGKIVAEGAPEELHRLTMNDGTLHVIVRGEEQAVRTALTGVKNAELISMEADEEGAFLAILKTEKSEDIREATFKSVCKSGLTLLQMSPGTKPLDDILAELTSERQSFALKKGDIDDEGNL